MCILYQMLIMKVNIYKTRNNYPLWIIISKESRDLLKWYQWRYHRKKLVPPSYYLGIESIEEIDRLMKQPTRFAYAPK